jgi:tetratricopeptide (TPR) repeat protein
MKRVLSIFWLATAVSVLGCIWDARTLNEEQKEHPDLAKIILDAGKPRPVDPSIREDIERLRNQPQPDNVDWINKLAGAYIRVGEPAEAVKLLETGRERFPDNYGVRANLGTAYHLLGRYADAEKEIAKDLEINPNAHFGLEKYHLALLQYLARDQEYQRRHLYVDEFTEGFFENRGNSLQHLKYEKHGVLPGNFQPSTPEEIEFARTNSWLRKSLPNESVFEDALQSEADTPPAYRFKWDLAADTNRTRGVMYMAELNPDQPAAMVMAGIIATEARSYNLAVAAFQRAIDLGSPQAELLRWHITDLEEYIKTSLARGGRHSWSGLLMIAATVVGFPILALLVIWRWFRRRRIIPRLS